jgi:hypothetical protein
MQLSAHINYPQSLLHLREICSDATAVATEDTRRVLLRRIKSNTPIGETGDLWAGWDVVADRYGFTIENDVPYAQYVEFGGPPSLGEGYSNWPNAGPRTVDTGGHIWSRQAVGGMLGPVVSDKEWLTRVVARIADHIQREIESGHFGNHYV